MTTACFRSNSTVRWRMRAGSGALRQQSDSESDLVAAFQRQDLPRLVGRRDLQAKSFDDLANLRHLIGIRLRELAGADPQAVFRHLALSFYLSMISAQTSAAFVAGRTGAHFSGS